MATSPTTRPLSRGTLEDALGPRVSRDDYDWSDQRNSRLLHAAYEQEPEFSSRAGARGPRLDQLNVMRESDVYNKGLLDGGVRQLWARNAEAPSIDLVRAAGLRPLEEPGADLGFEVIPLKGDHFRASFFVIDNVGWIYSPASAKRSNSRGDNEFTATMCSLIEDHQPRILDAVSFTRLVRSLEHGPALGAACGRYVDQVRAGQNVLDFKSNAQGAHMLWTFLSAQSATERDEIQQRHTAGLLAKYERGHWLFGENGIPTGYVKEARRIRAEPSRRKLVRSMFDVLVSDQHSSTQVAQLVKLGVWPDAPANPRAALWRKLRWTPLYVNGVWVQLLANPLPGIDEWMRLPVIRTTSHDPGHFELFYRPGLPPGGWLDDDVADAALALLRAAQTPRIGGRVSYQPFAAIEWRGPISTRPGDWDWRLCPGRGRYDIRVRRHPTR
jgi:hypothetical protein